MSFRGYKKQVAPRPHFRFFGAGLEAEISGACASEEFDLGLCDWVFHHRHTRFRVPYIVNK